MWGAVLLDEAGKVLYVHFEYIPRRDNLHIIELLKATMGPEVTEIASDCWGGTLKAMREAFPNVDHKKVNHKKTFVAEDGTNTNTIESFNNVIKQTLKQRWAHMPQDAYLLDVKVAFAQLIINCNTKRLNLNPFQVMLGELFAYGAAAKDPDVDPDVVDGWSTDEDFAMGEDEDFTDVESVAARAVVPVPAPVVEPPDDHDEPRAKVPRRSARLAERSTNEI